jgi:hypothetical protein
MRVTKTIREFIEKEVSNRLDAKYTAEKEEADFQTKVEQEVWEVAMDAAQKAYDEYMAGVFARYDFLEDLHTDKERRCVELRKSMAFGIKDRLNRSSVLNWRRRKDDEARSIVNDIIVELELGGDKATLMAMLDKVGEV